MVKHTQTIRRLLPMNCLKVFDHSVGFTLKGLIDIRDKTDNNYHGFPQRFGWYVCIRMCYEESYKESSYKTTNLFKEQKITLNKNKRLGILITLPI